MNKKVICACLVLMAYTQVLLPPLVVAGEDMEPVVIDGVVQDPVEPTEPDIIILNEDEYLRYFEACAEAVEDGEPILDYEDYVEEQGTTSGILTGWLFDDAVVHAVDSSVHVDTPVVSFDSDVSVSYPAFDTLYNLLKDYFSSEVGGTSSDGSGGGSNHRQSITIPKYYDFRGRQVVQYGSGLREAVVMTVSYIVPASGQGSGTYTITRQFNSVATAFQGDLLYMSEPFRYFCDLNSSVPQLSSVGYLQQGLLVSPAGSQYWMYDNRDYYTQHYFMGSGIFQTYLVTVYDDSRTNLTNENLLYYNWTSGRIGYYEPPPYTIVDVATNDIDYYRQATNDKNVYKQWNYPITYNNTFQGGDTINTTNVNNYNDYGLTVNNLGYLDFDESVFLDHLVDLQADIDANFRTVYERLPEPDATYELYDGTYYYPFETAEEVPATSSGGDVYYTIDVNIDWATYDPLSTEYVGVPVDVSVLRPLPEDVLQDGADWMRLFTYFWDKLGYLPLVLGVMALLLVVNIIGR